MINEGRRPSRRALNDGSCHHSGRPDAHAWDYDPSDSTEPSLAGATQPPLTHQTADLEPDSVALLRVSRGIRTYVPARPLDFDKALRVYLARVASVHSEVIVRRPVDHAGKGELGCILGWHEESVRAGAL